MNFPPFAPPPKNPLLLQHAHERAQHLENRVADAITGLAGSMSFVYLHVALFVIWMAWLERPPWPTLTLAVSLEAIFLSTFVMISQNRADARRQVLADHQWEFIQMEALQNEELLRLSNQILEMTKNDPRSGRAVTETHNRPDDVPLGDHRGAQEER